jgi:hypothetical protein
MGEARGSRPGLSRAVRHAKWLWTQGRQSGEGGGRLLVEEEDELVGVVRRFREKKGLQTGDESRWPARGGRRNGGRMSQRGWAGREVGRVIKLSQVK